MTSRFFIELGHANLYQRQYEIFYKEVLDKMGIILGKGYTILQLQWRRISYETFNLSSYISSKTLRDASMKRNLASSIKNLAFSIL